MIRLFFAAACVAAISLPAAAQDRAALRAACQGDVQKLCAGVTPGGGRIVACMKEKRAQVSPGCGAALAKAGVK